MKSFVFLSSLFAGLLFASSISAEPLPPPEFSHPAGTYDQPFELEIMAEEGVAIYYTTNGRAPTPSSEEYKQGEPIPISGSVMIRARAYDEEGIAGETVTKIYSQLARSVVDFDSDLPLVIVHQFDQAMHPEGHSRTPAYFTVIDTDEDGRARLLSDDLHLHSRTESNYRGSSSLQFPKKQFGVRLIDEQSENRNEPILGMPSENNWIMHAPYDDKTLMRNAVAYQLSEDMGRYAPRTRFVELFLHEGDGPVSETHYHGVYMLVERIKWDNNRVDIAKLTPEDNSEPEITGGYIINYDRDEHIWSTERRTGFALVRPQDWDITREQRNWISGYLGDLESALFGPDFRDPEEGYAAYLEPESFIDHHLITEALKEIDGYRLSTYLHKDREDRLVMGPVWDYNISLGNGDYLQAWQPHGWYYTQISEEDYLNGWYRRMFEDPEFEERYRERWWELRQGPFATEHIVNMIRDYADKLDEAQQRNFERWPILGHYVWPNHFIGDTYEEEVEYMIDWVERRMRWIDSRMGDPPDDLPEKRLAYYWVFDETLPNNTPFESLEADYSLLNKASLQFHSALEGYPFDEEHPDWRKASMERRNRPIELNYREKGNHSRPFDHDAMRALQVRQPFTGDGGENTLVFDLPTAGMGNVVFRFAAMDEGAADELLIDYAASVDEAGEPEWTTDGLSSLRHPLSFEYQLYELDFSDVSEVDSNPEFRIRIRFDGEDLSADDGNRVSFNNFSLDSGTEAADTTGSSEGEQDYNFRLEQNYPNPFNESTVINYQLSESRNVLIEVYDVLGRRVATLVDEPVSAGEHQVHFDAEGLASGLYVYKLQAGEKHESRTMSLIK